MRPNLIFSITFTLLIYSFFVNSCSDLSRLTRAERQEIAIHSFQKGLKTKNDGNNDKAIQYFKKAIEADSTFVDAYSEIGEILILRGDYRNVESILSSIPITVRRDAEIYYLTGSAQFYQKKMNDAVVNLEKSIQIAPYHWKASWMLAQLYFQLENYKHASDYLERLLEDSLSAGNEKIVALSQKVNAILHIHNPRNSFENELLKNLSQSNTVTRGQFAHSMVIEFRELSDGATTATRFLDVSDDNPMIDFYKRSVIMGALETLPDGKFYPEYVMKRRNIAYYLYRFLREKTPNHRFEKEMVLSDVDKNDFQFDAIITICRQGIMSLTADGQFRPNEPISGLELMQSITAVKNLLETR
ncbi:S-layer homology domain-containing protein [bacterium]|nr:S-layer homology domain-containing protein [bacterium]